MILTINNTHIRYEAIESVGASDSGRMEVRTVSGRTHFVDQADRATAQADADRVRDALLTKTPVVVIVDVPAAV